MKKLKINLLSLKYEIELKQNNMEHLTDYIATKVILAFLKSNPTAKEDFKKINQIDLNYLIHYLLAKENNKLFKVPTIDELNYLMKKQEKNLKKYGIPIGTNELYAASVWLKLMVKCGIVKENQIIELREYKLVDFITDPKLIEITNINKISNVSFYDFIVDRPKGK